MILVAISFKSALVYLSGFVYFSFFEMPAKIIDCKGLVLIVGELPEAGLKFS
jgi:hypothetical protein